MGFWLTLSWFLIQPLTLLAGETLNAQGQALVQKYCYGCHADGMSRGGFAIDEIQTVDPNQAQQEKWKKAWKIVRQEFMPPAGKKRPSDVERRAITQWIEQQPLGVDYEHPDPGRVTIRRLNRMEYEYTVTDLFGTDLSGDRKSGSLGFEGKARISDRLPPNDTAFGFETIGDFQSLSPALLEKYFGLAEYIIGRVLVMEGPRVPELVIDSGVTVSRTEGSKQTEHTVTFDLEHNGQYAIDIQFTLGGWQEAGGGYAIAIATDEDAWPKVEIEIGGDESYEYHRELALEGGTHTFTLVTDPLKPDHRGEMAPLRVRPWIKVTGPLNAGIFAYPESHQRIFFRGTAPDDSDQRRGYARDILRRIADRAFRRPVDENTLERLVDLAMANPVFERGIGQAITAILTSPRFLFRAELQPRPDDPDTVHPIDEYALASRLSYLLWMSLPDDELFDLAGRGALRENLEAQVRRMLADDKSSRFFEDFPGQWLRTRNVLMTAISRDDDLDPVRGSMKRETEMLFEYIARNDRDLIELVTADYSFMDAKLAEYYGVPDFKGEGFHRVQLAADSKRGGILTHGSFLVSTSNPNRTSPVKRGLFVLENLLGIEPPPPPPNVPPLMDPPRRRRGEPQPEVPTIREQLAKHRENRSCAACHAHFDPIGIVLEHYDLKGQWRDEEGGKPIVTEETTVTGETLAGIADLKQLFTARKDTFYRCVTEKLMTYALGRGLDARDAVTVDRIADQVAADGGRFSTLLLGVVQSPAFQLRRGDDGELREGQGTAIPKIPPPEMRRPQRRRGRRFDAEAPQQERPAIPAEQSEPSRLNEESES